MVQVEGGQHNTFLRPYNAGGQGFYGSDLRQSNIHFHLGTMVTLILILSAQRCKCKAKANFVPQTDIFLRTANTLTIRN